LGELDETPDVPKDNKGIYCRSWCPLHPEVNKIVFALIDELIDAFDSDSFQVGMDEVFLVAHPGCARCKGKDPAELFAKSVNDLHGHIVGERKQTMLMWADRLLDDKKLGYGKWESSANGTAPAIDRVPKDIILCDWHHETRAQGYPSVAYLQEKGFRVLPSSWRNKDAALAMLRLAQVALVQQPAQRTRRLVVRGRAGAGTRRAGVRPDAVRIDHAADRQDRRCGNRHPNSLSHTAPPKMHEIHAAPSTALDPAAGSF
jgi:hypothetical protein